MKRTPVSVQSSAFLFCRITITLLIWIAFLWQSLPVLWLAFAILLLSALGGIDRAPMIVLYSQTAGRMWPGARETLDRGAMRFAHTLGTILCGICIACIIAFPASPLGWRLVFLLAVLKTISACGFCPASKLYTCATGGCCPLSRRFFK